MTQILVVDDDEDFAGAIRMVLQSRGFDVADGARSRQGARADRSSGSPTR